MEVIVFIIICVLVLGAFGKMGGSGGSSPGVGGFLGGGGKAGDEARLVQALHKYGVTKRSSFPLQQIGQRDGYDAQGRGYSFSGTDKAGIQVSGEVWIYGVGTPTVTFDDSGAGGRIAQAAGRLAEAEAVDEATLDIEERVRREVGRRLDALQADRASFLESDTDGDGMVDSDEWAKARAQVEADVRAELGEAPPEEAKPEAEVASQPVATDEGW